VSVLDYEKKRRHRSHSPLRTWLSIASTLAAAVVLVVTLTRPTSANLSRSAFTSPPATTAKEAKSHRTPTTTPHTTIPSVAPSAITTVPAAVPDTAPASIPTTVPPVRTPAAPPTTEPAAAVVQIPSVPVVATTPAVPSYHLSASSSDAYNSTQVTVSLNATATANGVGYAGDAVEFSASCGSTSAVTNSAGQAAATLVCPVSAMPFAVSATDSHMSVGGMVVN